MLNEGIETVELETAAEAKPFQLKNYLKNYLTKNGIKVDEKKSMGKSMGDWTNSRPPGHQVDLFRGYRFRLHNEHLDRKFFADFSIKGNKARVVFEWNNKTVTYSTKLSDSKVEDYADFIVDSWKKYESNIREKYSSLEDEKIVSIGDTKNIIESIDVGDEFRIQYLSERHRHEVTLKPSLKGFTSTNQYAPKGKETLMRLLRDSQVKKKLSDINKKIGESDQFAIPNYLYAFVNEKEKVFDAIEKLVEGCYENGLKFSFVDFDRGVIEFKIPKQQDPYYVRQSRPSKIERTKVKRLSEKEAIRKAKRLIVNVKEAYIQRDKELIEIASQPDVAHMIIKRFFKDPKQYI